MGFQLRLSATYFRDYYSVDSNLASGTIDGGRSKMKLTKQNFFLPEEKDYGRIWVAKKFAKILNGVG